jgi:YegS/Rv2252/BmrU family lipid kinase
MKIAFLINRTVRKHDKIVREIETVFKGMDIKFFHSEYPAHIMALAGTAIQRGYKYIIAVGGDGTLNESINGIIQAFKVGLSDSPESYNWEGVADIKIGLLPAGTGNDFSRTTGITGKAEHLLALIKGNRTQQVDIGLASFVSIKDLPVHRFFINITDVGMGGVVVKSIAKKHPFLSGTMLYNYTIMKTFLTYDKSGVKCHNDEFQWEGKVMNLVVANGKYFGGGLGVAPEASINDGQFSVVILGNINLVDYLRYLGDVRACRKIVHPEVHYHSFDKLTIESNDGKPLAIDMDGEFVGYAPMTVVNLPRKVNIFM